MNRTRILLGLAAGLALLALALGRPGGALFLSPLSTPSPDGAVRLTSKLSHPVVPVGTSEVFLTVDLEGAPARSGARTPVSLALVIDRSGSMEGHKLEQAKAAAARLVGLLAEGDRLAIVHFGSDVQRLPGLRATAENRDRMRRYIEEISVDGGTYIEAGLAMGREELRAAAGEYAVSRLLLLSDGRPTEGLTDAPRLAGLARSLRQDGITVSALGVGEDFDEDLMQGIAEAGAGAYGYLDDPARIAAMFEKDLLRAATTVAREVVLRLELPVGVEGAEVLGYRSSREGRDLLVPIADLAAGQRERVVARLTVNAGASAAALPIATVRVDYRDVRSGAFGNASTRLSARASESADEVRAGRDRDATVAAARALSAANLSQAAEDLKRGEPAKAQARFEDNGRLFEEAEALAGAGAMAADKAEGAAMQQLFGAAAAPAAIERSVKEAKSKSLKAFGRIGSTY